MFSNRSPFILSLEITISGNSSIKFVLSSLFLLHLKALRLILFESDTYIFIKIYIPMRQGEGETGDGAEGGRHMIVSTNSMS